MFSRKGERRDRYCEVVQVIGGICVWLPIFQLHVVLKRASLGNVHIKSVLQMTHILQQSIYTGYFVRSAIGDRRSRCASCFLQNPPALLWLKHQDSPKEKKSYLALVHRLGCFVCLEV